MRIYPAIFRLVFSHMDAERAHHIGFSAIRWMSRLGGGPLLRWLTQPSSQLAVNAMGLSFASPFGLAAGFDKEASGVVSLGNLGFGHIEVGTITAQAQPGNPRPRLFRLIPDRAVINRMGFNNAGANAVLPRIEAAKMQRHVPVVGVNIGKTKVVALSEAVQDYVQSAQLLSPVADYLVVNVSSPNTPGLRSLQTSEQLEPLLRSVKKNASGKPLLVKIAPDLTDEDIVDLAKLTVTLELDGIIATNTTTSRENLVSAPEAVAAAGEGGLSGEPLRNRSLEVLRLLRQHVPADMCLISVGGITSGRDVLERLQAGATLTQGYTGFLYEGPFWARHINRELVKLGFVGNASRN